MNKLIDASDRFGKWIEVLKTDTCKFMINDRTMKLCVYQNGFSDPVAELTPVELVKLGMGIQDALKK